jgi:RND family efflux transporter MFP subunit
MSINTVLSSRAFTRLAYPASALVVGGITAWMAFHARAHASPASEAAVSPTAGVAEAMRADLFRVVTIPAEFRPYQEVDLHAKVSGYLQTIAVDFGDKVKAGQVLATLEVPELRAELVSAQSAEQKAAADHTNAHLICTRLLSVNKEHPNLVAQQELDTAAANDASTCATLEAAKANADKFRSLVDYTKITAPFDGIVTRRYADPGALIQAGTSSEQQSRPLVRVCDNYRLRLDFPVTVGYVKDLHIGDAVKVRVESLNGRTFTGTISRFTQQVSEETRTMTAEVDVPNADLQLVPGMYASVECKVEQHPGVLTIPTEAISHGNSPTVLVVNKARQIEERSVKLGLETPDKYEVLSGLEEGDLVVIGNRAGFQTGQKVEPKLIRLSLLNEH